MKTGFKSSLILSPIHNTEDCSFTLPACLANKLLCPPTMADFVIKHKGIACVKRETSGMLIERAHAEVTIWHKYQYVDEYGWICAALHNLKRVLILLKGSVSVQGYVGEFLDSFFFICSQQKDERYFILGMQSFNAYIK